MPSTWQTVRVFLSSTFRDMHAERDHLVKVVFPELRERLAPHRIDLIDIDLRWGVTKEQADNDRVLELCLQQIDECQFFLGLLGERYGWTPARLPANALTRFGWLGAYEGRSVTEMEIVHGVLRDPPMRGRAYFYFRDPRALQEIPEPLRSAVFADTDPAAVARLTILKRLVRAAGRPLFDGYPARWNPAAPARPGSPPGRLEGLEDFGVRVTEDLWRGITDEYALPPDAVSPAGPDEDVDAHERFIESRLRVYNGREAVAGKLAAYAAGEEPLPCVLSGPAGAGKTAALAKFVTDHRRAHPEDVVVPHVVGAGPRTTTLRDLLARFCRVLRDRVAPADDLPADADGLIVAFRQLVDRVAGPGRVVFVADALDQLDDADQGRRLSWLPTVLPPTVRIVLGLPPGSVPPGRRWHEIAIGPLSESERREIIRELPSLSAKTLDDNQVERLLANPATANPLYLIVALEELRGFGSFEQLNQRIAAFPASGDTVPALFAQVLERLEADFDPEVTRVVLASLVAARRGLAEGELRDLVGGADDLFRVLRQLRPYLLMRGGLVGFFHNQLREAARARYLVDAAATRAAHRRLADYFQGQPAWAPNTRPPAPNTRRADEIVWQLLRAGAAGEAAAVLTAPDFLEAKASAGLVFDLPEEFATADVLAADDPRRRLLGALAAALRRDINFVAIHPDTLFQCLWNAFLSEGPLPEAYQCGAEFMAAWRAGREAFRPGATWIRSLRPPRIPLGAPLLGVLRGHQDRATAVAASADGKLLASAGEDLTARLWRTEDGAEVACLRGHLDDVTAIAFDPSSGRVVTGSLDRTVRVWDTETWAETVVLRGHRGPVHAVAVAPDGRLIASGSVDRTVRIWDPGTGDEVGRLTGPASGVVSLAFQRDGSAIAAGYGDGSVRLWDVVKPSGSGRAGRLLRRLSTLFGGGAARSRELRGHSEAVNALSFSPDGRRLAAGSTDRTARVWNLPDGAEAVPAVRFGDTIRGLAFASDGAELFVAVGNEVSCLNCSPGSNPIPIGRHDGTVSGVTVLPSGDHVASSSWDGTVRVWRTATAPAAAGDGDQGGIIALAFTADGRRLATGSEDATAQIWDVESGRMIAKLAASSADPFSSGVAIHLEVSKVGWIAGGVLLFTLHRDDVLRVWEVERRAVVARLRLPATTQRGRSPSGHLLYDRKLGQAAQGFSRDEKLAVKSLADNDKVIDGVLLKHTAVVQEPAINRIIACLIGHDSPVTAVALTLDGTMAATAAADGTLFLWDARTGQPIMPMPGDEAAGALEFSADGRRLAAGFGTGTVRVWDVQSPRLLARFLSGGGAAVIGVGFTDDGRVVTCDATGEVLVRDVPVGPRYIEVPAPPLPPPPTVGLPPAALVALGRDTMFEDYLTGEPLAWFPNVVKGATAGPGWQIWAGIQGEWAEEHLVLVRLEGPPPARRVDLGPIEVAAAFARRGDWPAALRIEATEEARLRAAGNHAGLALCLERRADIQSKRFMVGKQPLDKVDVARCFAEAEQLWEALGRPLDAARCLKGRMPMITAALDPNLLDQTHGRLEQIYRAAGDRAALAAELKSWGILHHARRCFEPALACYREGEAIERELGHWEAARATRKMIAMVCDAVGVAPKPLPPLPETAIAAEDAAALPDSPTGLFDTKELQHMIRTFLESDRMRATCDEEECRCRVQNRPAALMLMLFVRAAACERRDEPAEAEKIWEECARLARSVGRPADRVQALVRRAMLLAGVLARPTDALVPLAEARRLVYDSTLDALRSHIDKARRLVRTALNMEAM